MSRLVLSTCNRRPVYPLSHTSNYVHISSSSQMEKTARLKAETKERTLRKFLLSQKDVVYTEPLEIQAGRPVTVFYNPSNTVLNGKPEVWFRGSFNRWTHRLGPLPPQKMEAADDGSSHVKTSGKIFILESVL